MSTPLPELARSLLDQKSFATIATTNPDGQPQLSVVWAARDGDDVLVSTVRGRLKTRNLERDPRATVLLINPVNPYSYVEIRGAVTLTEQGGRELIDDLHEKYVGTRPYPNDGPDDVRVIVRLTATKVVVRA